MQQHPFLILPLVWAVDSAPRILSHGEGGRDCDVRCADDVGVVRVSARAAPEPRAISVAAFGVAAAWAGLARVGWVHPLEGYAFRFGFEVDGLLERAERPRVEAAVFVAAPAFADPDSGEVFHVDCGVVRFRVRDDAFGGDSGFVACEPLLAARLVPEDASGAASAFRLESPPGLVGVVASSSQVASPDDQGLVAGGSCDCQDIDAHVDADGRRRLVWRGVGEVDRDFEEPAFAFTDEAGSTQAVTASFGWARGAAFGEVVGALVLGLASQADAFHADGARRIADAGASVQEAEGYGAVGFEVPVAVVLEHGDGAFERGWFAFAAVAAPRLPCRGDGPEDATGGLAGQAEVAEFAVVLGVEGAGVAALAACDGLADTVARVTVGVGSGLAFRVGCVGESEADGALQSRVDRATDKGFFGGKAERGFAALPPPIEMGGIRAVLS